MRKPQGKIRENKRVPKAIGAQMKLETHAFAKLLATQSGIFLRNAQAWRQGFRRQVRVCALQYFELPSGLEETRRIFATACLRCAVIQILTLEV